MKAYIEWEDGSESSLEEYEEYMNDTLATDVAEILAKRDLMNWFYGLPDENGAQI